MAFGRDRPSALSLLRQLGRLPDTLLAPARLHNHSKHRPFDANGMRDPGSPSQITRGPLSKAEHRSCLRG